jgi:hypothetical protein
MVRLDRLATATAIGVLVSLLWTVFMVFVDVFAIVAVTDGDSSMLATSEDLDAVTVTTAWWTLAVVVVPFLWWFHAAHRRLAALVSPIPRRPAWAVISWFVPVVWWVVPYRATRALWHAGDVDAPGDTDWARRPAPRIVRWWWALWLGTWPFSLASGFVLPDRATDDLDAWRTGHALDLVVMVLTIVATPVFIVLVRTITARLDAAARSQAASTTT